MDYKHVIKQMTLEEKVSLLSGKNFWESQELERLNVPGMFLADGPHGIRRQAAAADHLGLNESIPATCYPTAATVANSWDVDLAQEVGTHLGREAASQQVNVLLGPGMNIKRNPLCGRNFEYFSEDPYLTGKMAAAYVRGIQAGGIGAHVSGAPSTSRGIAACIKHFAVNNQETRRMSIDVVVDERTLREIYLTGFEIAVREGKPRVVMSSYNKVNGEYTNENMHLLREILRDEWGFQGCVVTDWGGGNERVRGLLAGNELEMPGTGGESNREVLEAVRRGELEEAVVDEALERLLALADETSQALVWKNQKIPRDHHQTACKAAEESIVLLKNQDSILPLDTAKTLAVIGDFAQTPRYQGAGSSRVNPTQLESALDRLESSELRIIGYEPGFHRFGKKSSDLVERACGLAAQADTVLLYLGLDEVSEAEGVDRTSLALPENQLELLEALAGVHSRIVVILSCGSVIEMPWIDGVSGVVHGYLGGQAGAQAMVRVLLGLVNPSGKLAETYPKTYQDVPSGANFPGGQATVEYREGPYVGYRYFDRQPGGIQFPFGFGLSYTSFEYHDLRVDSRGARFTLRNTGALAGKEVVQLYIQGPGQAVYRPEKELKGFTKVYLEPGESREVRLVFDAYSFRFFNLKKNAWDVESGMYTILIGASSRDIRLQDSLSVQGSDCGNLYDRRTLEPYFTGEVENIAEPTFAALVGRPLPEAHWGNRTPMGYNDPLARTKYARGWFGRLTHSLIIFAHWLLWKIGQRDTANLIMMSFYNMPFRGIAKMMGGMVSRRMAEGFLMMVNGHFFKGFTRLITKEKQEKEVEYEYRT